MNTQTRTIIDQSASAETGSSLARAEGGHVSFPMHAWLMPILVVLAILCGLSIALSVSAINESARGERETRMLEYYVMENDGKLVNAGIIKPAETWSARKQELKK